MDYVCEKKREIRQEGFGKFTLQCVQTGAGECFLLSCVLWPCSLQSCSASVSPQLQHTGLWAQRGENIPSAPHVQLFFSSHSVSPSWGKPLFFLPVSPTWVWSYCRSYLWCQDASTQGPAMRECCSAEPWAISETKTLHVYFASFVLPWSIWLLWVQGLDVSLCSLKDRKSLWIRQIWLPWSETHPPQIEEHPHL